ncbi:hypothetical protein ACWCRD_32720 [Streptomyces sp. NPDC002092]
MQPHFIGTALFSTQGMESTAPGSMTAASATDDPAVGTPPGVAA